MTHWGQEGKKETVSKTTATGTRVVAWIWREESSLREQPEVGRTYQA